MILLPSDVTEEFAQRLRSELEGTEVVILPLPGDDENDADRAYSHFDTVLAETLQTASPEHVVVDFTPRHQGHERRTRPGGDSS